MSRFRVSLTPLVIIGLGLGVSACTSRKAGPSNGANNAALRRQLLAQQLIQMGSQISRSAALPANYAFEFTPYQSLRSTNQPQYLGQLSANRYSSTSTSNQYGLYGSKYSPTSIHNPYGPYGSKYSPDGARNQYTTGGPRIYGQDGTYLGRLNSNPYDPQSVANPYGVHGSKYSADSINNPYSRFGSPYSTESARNPYATSPPIIVGD